MKSFVRALVLILCLCLLFNCSDPGGLESVAGIEGVLKFDREWPDSLTAAVVVVFDVDLNLDSLEAPDYAVVDHFITFSNPIDSGLVEAEYFIQLQPGGYLLLVVGLLVEPAQLLTNDELFQQIQNYIVIPENFVPRGSIVREQEINEQTVWNIRF
ncbi:hypothetical protein HQ531_10410 [bacterium]|nr:hypothetical protein [bacterium]